MNEEERAKRARERAHELREFYTHLTVYVVVNVTLIGGLFLINWITSPGGWWFYWPLLGTGIGWGIGLIIHALNVFGKSTFLGDEWEERKAQQLLERDSR